VFDHLPAMKSNSDFSRREVLRGLALAAGGVAVGPARLFAKESESTDEPVRSFKHPGLLHSQEDLDRMKSRVAAGDQPWLAGFQQLALDWHSSSAWRMFGPLKRVVRDRDPQRMRGNAAMVQDSRAAYQNALMWAVAGEKNHATKAVEILNAWGQTLEEMGGRDVQLAAGLNGFLLVNAAEIMRHSYSDWNATDADRFQRMLREVVYPPIQDFATFANGNWDAACIKTMLAIGVFCDDRSIFDRGVEYFLHGTGNGSIGNYVFNTTGQCQESGRDQQHTQLGLGCLAEACEVAWQQGADLYGAEDNRLLRGYEYTAQYLLGEAVPFVEHTDTTGKYHHTKIAPEGRFAARPVYEIALGHYAVRQGLAMPFSTRLAERNRPEGRPHGADHPGFGTLTFCR
jgi:hypothetical protein